MAAPTDLLPRGAEASMRAATGKDFVLTSVEPLSGGIGNQSGSVLLLRGHGDGHDRSVVLKIIRRSPPGSPFPVIGTIPEGWGLDVDHSHYWRREALFYASDLPARLANSHARAPTVLLVRDHDDEAWIWLEALDDLIPGPWSADQLAHAANHVARLQARAIDLPLPKNGGVRSGLLRAYVEELLAATIAAAGDDATWEHPFVRSVLPGSNAERLRRLISHRERLLDALDVAPAVLTHHDGHRRNILTIDKSVSVLIDWAYAGTGAIGEQLGSLVGMTIMLGEVDAVDMRGATNDAIDAYLGGLSDEGWRGDTSHVRFAAHVACALQAGLITSSLADLTSLDATKDPSLHQLFEEHADHMAGLLDLFLWSAAEAWRLLDRM